MHSSCSVQTVYSIDFNDDLFFLAIKHFLGFHQSSTWVGCSVSVQRSITKRWLADVCSVLQILPLIQAGCNDDCLTWRRIHLLMITFAVASHAPLVVTTSYRATGPTSADSRLSLSDPCSCHHAPHFGLIGLLVSWLACCRDADCGCCCSLACSQRASSATTC